MVRRLCVGLVLASFVACGGGSGPSTPTMPGGVTPPSNRPPVISSVTAVPSVGVADVDRFRFEVTATDPDGDPLTYLWDLGHGATWPDRTTSVLYEGGQSTEWTVRVVVTDPRGATAAGSVSVMVLSVNGMWRIAAGVFVGGELGLLQDAAGVVTGRYLLPGAGSYEDLRDGRITSAAGVTLPLRLGSRAMTFTGTMDATGRRIVGTLDGRECVLVVP